MGPPSSRPHGQRVAQDLGGLGLTPRTWPRPPCLPGVVAPDSAASQPSPGGYWASTTNSGPCSPAPHRGRPRLRWVSRRSPAHPAHLSREAASHRRGDTFQTPALPPEPTRVARQATCAASQGGPEADPGSGAPVCRGTRFPGSWASYLLLRVGLPPCRYHGFKLNLQIHLGPPGGSLLKNLRYVLKQKISGGYERRGMEARGMSEGLSYPLLGTW